jgi:hypothetical protein
LKVLAARFYDRVLVLLQKTQAVDLKAYLSDPTGFFGGACSSHTLDIGPARPLG